MLAKDVNLYSVSRPLNADQALILKAHRPCGSLLTSPLVWEDVEVAASIILHSVTNDVYKNRNRCYAQV